jgi:hypothetical protein
VSRSYTAPKTIAAFIRSVARVQLLLGPIGGGKTTGVLMQILMLSHQQAPNQNNERKTRWACVRNTRPQLRDSVLKTVFDWLVPNGTSIIWREADMTLMLNFPLPDGTRLRSEILFRALDDEQDARRLLSVEFTGVWLSEFREIPLQLLTDALSRTGRYPSAADGGCSWHGLLAESNMPIRGSDWHRYMELEKPSYAEVFIQPSGIAADAENVENLPSDYYSILMEGTSEVWQKAHILCEYPDSLDGKAVWSASFNYARHVAKSSLAPLKGAFAPPIIIGVDQGRSPAAVFGQMQPNGKLRIFKEAFAAGVSMETFCAKHLRPIVTNDYSGMQILVVIDPAGTYKGQATDDSPADILRRAGFRVIGAPTNDPGRRLDAVDRFLNKGEGFEVDPACKTLVSAMASDYRFRTKKDGELEDRPEKKHPISDLADALQYLCLIAGGDNYGRVLRKLGRMNTGAHEAPPVHGWT